MPYIPIEINNGINCRDIEITQTTYKDLKLKETDIEEFIRTNTELIFGENETLLIVGQQVQNQEKGISDLIAVDEDGYLVLIEIKRDLADIKLRKEPFEFQAIRYAASCAKMTKPSELVDRVFVDYIEKHKNEFELSELTPREKATRVLNDFLIQNDAVKTFNKKQRIILIASTYDRQTESAVAWLISNGVDITTFTMTPVCHGKDYYLNLEKILPPPNITDFLVEISRSTMAEIINKKQAILRTSLPRMNKLFEWELIEKGDRLRIKNHIDSEAIAIDYKNVEFKNEKMTYNQWGQKITGWSSICIYEWAVPIEKGKTLAELRLEKMEEIEKEANG